MKKHCIFCGEATLEHEECVDMAEYDKRLYDAILYHCLSCEAEWIGSSLGNRIIFEGVSDVTVDMEKERERWI